MLHGICMYVSMYVRSSPTHTHTLSHFRKTVAMAAASQLLELALTIKPDSYLWIPYLKLYYSKVWSKSGLLRQVKSGSSILRTFSWQAAPLVSGGQFQEIQGKVVCPYITMKGSWKSMLLSCILCIAENENHTLCQERWSWKQLRDLVGTNPDIHHQHAILYETNGYNSYATDKRTLSRATALINSVKMFYTHTRHEGFPLTGSQEDRICPRIPPSPPQFWICVGHLEAV